MADTPKKPSPLLDDLESIRALLGDDFPEADSPDAALDPAAIPLLSEVVAPVPDRAPPAASPTAPAPTHPATQPSSQQPGQRTPAERKLDSELRAAANLILQDVIDDFVPQIEAELKRRLEGLIQTRKY
ncbi:DNA polymerase III subunit chi [Stutzerimonas azotifigens]|uniref:DNA polymerase III subunit chi n=1 Tax=Stutzerimonas azotifigens TaxID=291995 RepID=A0ABR5YXB1_9GAMM|nr:DNA polymerase III subunit chi [Stutzerimonas azotifigens]MBA1272553.1 DNA polymerase III subunit chi [Stutzerimonas azotifigens]